MAIENPEIVLEEISQYSPEQLFDHLSGVKGFVYLDGQMDSKWSQFGVMGIDPFASFVSTHFVQTFSLGSKKEMLVGCPFKNLEKKNSRL